MHPELPGVPEEGQGEGQGGAQGEGGVVHGQHQQDVTEGMLHVQIGCSQNRGRD